ncbi:hypothetical protein [Shewanella cyperi]|uniref:hypothetical protein n=1 Tax=Shewanella cyperi TaxID=2814292 RepID=UPI001A9477C2|nr:hypothetical protein [Shewanella cyperi]QSX40674.1 hypothetical protein JYB84_17290 [Shewanella cyperi]
MRGLTLLLCLLSALATAAEPTRVTYVDATSLKHNPNNSYFGLLLQLALEKSSDKYGPFELKAIDIEISQKRHLRELEKGTIDVFWTMTSYGREVEARPVRVPLTKGMYGIRLLAINKADSELYANITDLKQLTSLTAIQGRDWPDTQVLRLNRLEVNTDVAEVDLYPFLARHPGSYFPRGVTEIFAETDNRDMPTVAVDRQLVLVYPAAMYFFVARDNELLANRLEYGLKRAQADGSFDQLFYGFPQHRSAFERADFAKRRFLYLQNPLLPRTSNADEIRAMQLEVMRRFGGK